MTVPAPASTPTAFSEVERSYALDPGVGLPAFDEVPDVAGSSEPRASTLDATYWDTPDLRLAARNVRLRRRTGGTDAGWHLKVPGPAGVTEVRLPAGREARTVPAALRSLVTSVGRGAPLRPVARLKTVRTEVDLLDEDGQVLAIVADDDVNGQTVGDDAVPHRWREIEVELAPAGAARPDGGNGLLDATERALRGVGAVPAVHPNKLARVLGTQVPGPWPAPATPPRRRSSAGDVLTAYLREQVDAVIAQDPRVRQDEEDSVHKMRVATRRLRSALRTFRPLFDRDRAEPLGVELKWLAAVLGGVRDREVLLARLLADVSGLPDEWVLGPVRARIDATVSADMEQARRTALAELDGQRYRALLDQLVEFAGEPALTPAAAERADRVVPALVAKAHRRVGRDLRHAHAATDPTAREEAFHDARKVAKRLRYAGEALTSAFGADARRLAERAEAVQEVLGEHQDSVVARAQLREMALAADDARENAFTYGLLVGVERSRAEAVEAQVDSVWKRLDTPKARRLLR